MLLTSDSPLGKVATALTEALGEYVSGEELARRLSVSRNAVWKQVEVLRRLGHRIDSSRRLGYRLVSLPDRPYPWVVTSGLGARSVGRVVRFYDRVASTQDVAAEWARAGAPEGAIVLAEEQVAGRGRQRSSFVAPRGGLWCSVVLRPCRPVSETVVLGMLGALAAARAVAALTPRVPRLLWPKELLIDGRKLGGAIVDVTADQDFVWEAVLGIGVNVAVPMDALPSEVRERAVSLEAAAGGPVPLLPLVRTLLEELERLYLAYREGGPGAVIRGWRGFPGIAGLDVAVEAGGVALAGEAIDVTDDGSLLLGTRGGVVRVSQGIVSLIRDGEGSRAVRRA